MSFHENFTENLDFGAITSSVTAFVLLLIVTIIAGAVIFFVFMLLRFNKRVVIFENISGQGYQPTGRDKAMLVSIGDGGEEVLYLRKQKVYRTAYGKKMGKNTYWFAVGQDGYWYNVTIEDLDKEMKTLQIKPIDRDMRYMSVAIRRNIKDRFERRGFLEKYGGLIAYTVLIAVTGIMMWLLFDKWLGITGSVQASIDASKEVLAETRRILGALDNLQSSGIT